MTRYVSSGTLKLNAATTTTTTATTAYVLNIWHFVPAWQFNLVRNRNIERSQ